MNKKEEDAMAYNAAFEDGRVSMIRDAYRAHLIPEEVIVDALSCFIDDISEFFVDVDN